jgi:protein subunit release factor A
MADIELRESEISTEILVPGGVLPLREQIAWLEDAPVRVTHIPTGVSAIGKGRGSQAKNREVALELLKAQLAGGGQEG